MQNQTQLALFIAVGCLVMFLLVMVIIVFVVTYQRKMLEKENKIAIIQQEQQLLFFKATVEAEEKQKERIANNLHDSVNPMLTLLKLNLSKHRMAFEKNKFNSDAYKGDAKMIDQVIESIRATCRELIPSFLLEFGLILSLEDHIKKISGEVLSTEVKNELPPEFNLTLDKQEQLLVYRICLELINNLIKHSGLTKLTMLLKQDTSFFYVQLFYDGNGISNEEIEKLTETSKGLGLRSLKARVLILQGQLTYEKNKPLSSIKLTLPLKL
ncbi:MAG: histidine kinase [Bacteroidota bacterium]|nr:histidine kinase [Bacteroidota bacterium]